MSTPTQGADSLLGTSGADTINALGGDDTIDAGSRTSAADSSRDVVDGGAGVDTLVVNASSQSQSVSLSRSGGTSFFVNSQSNDYGVDAYNIEKIKFTGGSGDDVIDTGAAGVVVNGGAGNDYWLADLGAVTSAITFELGATTAISAAGLTQISGIEQINLTTGSGADTLIGGAFADSIYAGGGADVIDARSRASQADSANDSIDGGSGTDTLVVDAHTETQSVNLSHSGATSWFVRSTSGHYGVDAYNVEKVKFTGGSGDDVIDSGSAGVVVKGGAGNDRWLADFSAVGSAITFDLATTSSIAAAGLTQLTGVEQIVLTSGSGADTLTGGAFADTIYAGGGADVLDARSRAAQADSANDSIDGGSGVDTLVVDAHSETQSLDLSRSGGTSWFVRSTSNHYGVDAYNVEKVKFTGGSGADVIDTGAAGVVVNGGAGADRWLADLSGVTSAIHFDLATTTSIAAAGLTQISGIEQIVLTTGSGADTLTGGAFADSIYAGGGADVIDLLSRASQADSSNDYVDGGAGTDTLLIDASGETQTVNLSYSGPTSWFVRSTSGHYGLDAYNVENVKFTGGSGDDVIQTGSHALVVQGGGGTDRWLADYSSLNDKIVFVLQTTDHINAADLQSLGGIEQIELTTGSGKDRIVGGDLADSISAGDGNDIVDAGSRRLQPDSANDLVHGGAGTDTLTVNADASAAGLQVSFSGSSIFVRSSDGGYGVDAYEMERLRLSGGGGADSVAGGAVADRIDGGDGGDTLSGAGGGDMLLGGTGNDSLDGGAGADNLQGENGADVLLGGDQGDTIDGGAGRDTMTGGAGGDVFVFGSIDESGRNSPDLITDLAGPDVIDLSGIDADTHQAGDQAFTIVAAFTNSAGQAVLAFSGGTTTLSLDVDGDGKADSIIAMTGDQTGHSAFVL